MELPNAAQRKALSEMMSWAFVEIRSLGWENRGQQVADLADTFHNLGEEMFDTEVDSEMARGER